MEEYLMVIRGGVRMNKNCRHRPKSAKDCPYCRVCPHGVTEYGACHECTKDQSWQTAPITPAEMDQVLSELERMPWVCSPCYSPRQRESDPYEPLLPLAVAKIREMIRAQKKKRANRGRAG